MDAHVVIGPPGTGKTTRLLGIVEQFLADGGDPERVAFVSFTKAAAHEAQDRAAERFGFTRERLPHFSTIHAAAFRQLGLRKGDLMGWRDYAAAAEQAGVALSSAMDEEGRPFDVHSAGDHALRIVGLAAARMETIRASWEREGHSAPAWPVVAEFAHVLRAAKRRRGLMEFSDLLRADLQPLPVDLFVVDEGQDLSAAQWSAVERLAASAKRLVVAGDDDQALYDWAGADSAHLAALSGTREVLPVSYRVPRVILDKALAQAARIRHRIPKTFDPRAEGGTYDTHIAVEHLDLSRTGSWLLLHRHRRGLAAYEHAARQQGVAYIDRTGMSSLNAPTVRAAVSYERLRSGKTVTHREWERVLDYCPGARAAATREVSWEQVRWPFSDRPDWMHALTIPAEDREYLRALRRNGVSLTATPSIRLSTIHGAKGAEADHVVLSPDVGRLPHEALVDSKDEEARVWYVGMTRARESLTVLRPSDWRHWNCP